MRFRSVFFGLAGAIVLTASVAPPAHATASCSLIPPKEIPIQNDGLAFIVAVAPAGTVPRAFGPQIFRLPCRDDPSRSALFVGFSPSDAGVLLCTGNLIFQQGALSYAAPVLNVAGERYCGPVGGGTSLGTGKYVYMLDFDNAPAGFDRDAAMTISWAATAHVGSATLAAYPGSGGSATNIKPHTGWWFNAAEAGRGWALGRQSLQPNDRYFFGGFFYADNGAQSWAIANLSRTDANQYQGELVACAGGQSLANPTPQAPGCTGGFGSVVMQVLSPRSIRVQVPRGGQGPATLDLVPFDSF